MNLTIADGEFVALPGSIGLRQVDHHEHDRRHAATEQLGRHTVRWQEDVSNVPMAKRGVGFVFQNYAIFTHMSVREQPRLWAYVHKACALGSDLQKRVSKRLPNSCSLTPMLDQPCRRAFSEHSSTPGDWPLGRFWSLRSSCLMSPCPTWTRAFRSP